MIALKNKALQILAFAICVFMLIGVWLGYNWLRNPDDVLEIKLANGYTKSIDFGDMSLIPGESRKYELKLTTNISGEKDIEFAFEKLGDSELVKFVYCEITVNDKVVCNRRLDMLTDGRSYTYTANTRLGQPLDVDIRYYMPESVSNEAQGASADIKLNITATNEKPIGE